MMSRAVTCGKSTILRQFAFSNHQLVRNLFILGLSSVARSQMATTDQIASPRPIISEVIPPAMAYTTKVSIPIVEYAEIKDLPNQPHKLLIDVREANEIEETGYIPTSINIPLGSFAQELLLSPLVFESKYGRTKPDIGTYIIVHCRSGKRAQKAAETAKSLGFKKVHTYAGSWLDWAEREGLSEKKNK